MNLAIRDAGVDDAGAVLAVLNPIISTESVALDAPVSEADERSCIAGFAARGIFHVALRDSELVGFQSLEPFATYSQLSDRVGALGTYVAAGHRRRGIATRLFAATFAAARAKGHEKLFTYVRADNPPGLAVYAAQGLRAVGRAERQLKAGVLKKSRSRLYGDAVREYVARHSAESVTESLDRLCDEVERRGGSDSMSST